MADTGTNFIFLIKGNHKGGWEVMGCVRLTVLISWMWLGTASHTFDKPQFRFQVRL